ncbi:LamG domain-containing protein [Patescibacteria group bacterium]
MHPRSGFSGNDPVFMKFDAWGDYIGIRHDTSNNIQFEIVYGNNYSCGVYSIPNSNVPDGVWTHLSYTFDSGHTEAYINGEVVGTRDCGVILTIPSYSNNWLIGSGPGKFDGLIDEARLYSRALSQAEIDELYNQGQAKINASQETKLTDGLVGNWTFDGNHMDWGSASEVLDQGSGGNDGDVVSLSTSDAVIGKVGQALDFDGVDDKIVVSHDNSLNIGTGDFTFNAWIYPKDVVNGCSGGVNCMEDYLFEKYQDNNNYFWVRFRDEDWLQFYSEVSNVAYGKQFNVNAATKLIENQWQMITILLNRTSDELIYYRNGAYGGSEPADNSITGIDFSNTGSFFIGAPFTVGAYSNVFNGSMDEVRTYNRALSSDEINQLYMMGK